MRGSDLVRSAALAGLAACSFSADPQVVDGPPGSADARRVDGRAIDADLPPTSGHLLLSEVRTNGTSEFVEIVNPTGTTVALDDYYLSDRANYWQLPGVVGGSIAPPATQNDFMARFPPGATLGPHAVAVAAIDGPAFALVFGVPDYTIGVPVSGALMMTTNGFGVDIPVSITNAGEMIVLFRWDGAADLVEDVDLVLAGNALAGDNAPMAKAAVDGPDADLVATLYEPDALTIEDMASDTNDHNLVLQSYKRIAAETGREVATGGNGVLGHDETSEQCRTTWDSRGNGDDYTLADPGTADF